MKRHKIILGIMAIALVSITWTSCMKNEQQQPTTLTTDKYDKRFEPNSPQHALQLVTDFLSYTKKAPTISSHKDDYPDVNPETANWLIEGAANYLENPNPDGIVVETIHYTLSIDNINSNTITVSGTDLTYEFDNFINLIEAYGNSSGNLPTFIDAEIEMVDGQYTVVGIDVQYSDGNNPSVVFPTTDLDGCGPFGPNLNAADIVTQAVNEHYENTWITQVGGPTASYNLSWAYSVVVVSDNSVFPMFGAYDFASDFPIIIKLSSFGDPSYTNKMWFETTNIFNPLIGDPPNLGLFRSVDYINSNGYKYVEGTIYVAEAAKNLVKPTISPNNQVDFLIKDLQVRCAYEIPQGAQISAHRIVQMTFAKGALYTY